MHVVSSESRQSATLPSSAKGRCTSASSGICSTGGSAGHRLGVLGKYWSGTPGALLQQLPAVARQGKAGRRSRRGFICWPSPSQLRPTSSQLLLPSVERGSPRTAPSSKGAAATLPSRPPATDLWKKSVLSSTPTWPAGALPTKYGCTAAVSIAAASARSAVCRIVSPSRFSARASTCSREAASP